MFVQKGGSLDYRPLGSGKSTILLCINGLISRDEGFVASAGTRVHE